MTKHGISLCMISRDNANCIDKCIQSVRHIVDQVVVALDDRTTDGTRSVAESCGAKVHDCKFEYFGQARDFSLSFAMFSWILVLDADETLLPTHGTIVRDTISRTNHDAFQFPRKNWKTLEMNELATFPFTGQPIPYPDYQIRLFKNVPYIRYGDQRVHESPKTPRSLGTVPHGIDINHFQFVYKGLDEARRSFMLYESLKADSGGKNV